MLSKITESHRSDADGNPTGGLSSCRGCMIAWQNGPLGRGENRIEPNGAFVEDIIRIASGRLRYFQQSKFACEANASAIQLLENALGILMNRTKDREERDVEGTHEI